MNHKAGFVSLIGSAMLFSLLGVIVRFFSGYFGNATQGMVRAFATMGVLALVMIVRSEYFKLNWKSVNRVAFVLYNVASIGATLFFILSVTQIKAANSVFYLYVASFITAFVISSLLLKDKLTIKSLSAIVLALTGLTIFSYPVEATLSLGVLFGLLAGVCDTLRFTSQKYLREVKRHTLLFYSYVTSGAVLLVVAVVSGEEMIQAVDTTLLIAIPLLGIIFLLLGETLLYGFNNFPLSLGTIVVSGELFFAIAVNALILKEMPTQNELLGAIVIFSSIMLVNSTLPNRDQLKVIRENA